MRYELRSHDYTLGLTDCNPAKSSATPLRADLETYHSPDAVD